MKRRPELFQQDAQERIAVDEARLALLQIAPNANLSLSLYDDPDKFLEWNNWMTAGVRISWNLLNIPARLAERRMANTRKEMAKQKGLALAAAVMSQVGIAYSDWRLTREYADSLERRAASRERLVEALAAGESDGQTRPGEVLQERVRLLSEKAASLRAEAEVRVAGARLANAIGLDVDDDGLFVWRAAEEGMEEDEAIDEKRARLFFADFEAEQAFPDAVSGLRVLKSIASPAADEPPGDEPRADAPSDDASPDDEPSNDEPPGEPLIDKTPDEAASEEESPFAEENAPDPIDAADASDNKPDAGEAEPAQTLQPPDDAPAGESVAPAIEERVEEVIEEAVENPVSKPVAAALPKTVIEDTFVSIPALRAFSASVGSTAVSVAGLLPFALDDGDGDGDGDAHGERAERIGRNRERDRMKALESISPLGDRERAKALQPLASLAVPHRD